MEINKLIDLYIKEREYQREIFGNYKDNPALNVASFLNFIETYLEKAKKSYSEPWSSGDENLWLTRCREYETQGGKAPIKTYEYLVKVMALTGAALEAFAEIEPSLWRTEGPKEKWSTSGKGE
jgi:hypothetical protein